MDLSFNWSTTEKRLLGIFMEFERILVENCLATRAVTFRITKDALHTTRKSVFLVIHFLFITIIHKKINNT